MPRLVALRQRVDKARHRQAAADGAAVWGNLPNGQRDQSTFNDNMLVVVMLETLDAIVDADEIASTFGLDLVIRATTTCRGFPDGDRTTSATRRC